MFADKPSVRIERHSESPLEAGRGSLSLSCLTSSNPPGRTMWWRQGQAAAPQYREQLTFDPVTREQAGDYVCAAENSVGRSEEARTSVEVLCKSHFHAPSVPPPSLSKPVKYICSFLHTVQPSPAQLILNISSRPREAADDPRVRGPR